DPEEHGGPGWIGRSLDEQSQPGGTASRLAGSGSASLFIGDGAPPVAVRGRRAAASALERLEDLALPNGSAGPLVSTPLGSRREPADGLDAFVRRSLLDAYSAAERVTELTRRRVAGADASYPDTPLAGKLRTVAHLLKADLGARVFYTIQGGYDTHAGQSYT